MRPDDKICYCYNVSLRKLVNFARQRPLRRPSQMSDCLGAGTGCGWCIPVLKRIFEAAADPAGADTEPRIEGESEDYAARRQDYIDNKRPKNRF
jgi:NAD(P)H-nitrite reductase large subunit